ncbi:sugar phosphate isomerase/epimerase family protein [Elioraea sp.]|uniref:sugar phosphate isomerase/epimerase family protein n=1 Tax=Elioraea sp. TaxID=2185103 RepID=UPI003F726098
MAGLARLSLNTATVRGRWDLPACIEGCARHGIGWIGPWRDGLAAYGVARAAQHIRDAGLKVSGLCRGGWWSAGTLAQAIDDNRRAIDEAAAIGAACLVIVNGGLPEGSRDLAVARARCLDGLAAVLPHAREVGVPLALEPLHPMTCADRSVLSTTAQALDWCDALGAGVGVALDIYHVWWDPEVLAQVARARGRILGLHVCDWLRETRDLVTDRGMMGDGVADIAGLREAVDAAGYDGPIEVEIFSSRDWWTRDPDEVLAVMKQRFERCV